MKAPTTTRQQFNLERTRGAGGAGSPADTGSLHDDSPQARLGGTDGANVSGVNYLAEASAKVRLARRKMQAFGWVHFLSAWE